MRNEIYYELLNIMIYLKEYIEIDKFINTKEIQKFIEKNKITSEQLYDKTIEFKLLSINLEEKFFEIYYIKDDKIKQVRMFFDENKDIIKKIEIDKVSIEDIIQLFNILNYLNLIGVKRYLKNEIDKL